MKYYSSVLISLLLSTPLLIATNVIAASVIPQDDRQILSADRTYLELAANYELGSAEIPKTTIALDSNDATFYYERGNVYRQEGKIPQAIAEYERAIQLDPEYADAYFARGVAYATQKKGNLALFDYNQALELDSQHADASYYRGFLYGKQGQIELAISD